MRMERKRCYEAPTVFVVELKVDAKLLTLSDPNDYNNGGNPFA